MNELNKIFALSDVYRDEKVKLTAEDDIEKTIGSIIMNRIINIAYKNLDLSEVE